MVLAGSGSGGLAEEGGAGRGIDDKRTGLGDTEWSEAAGADATGGIDDAGASATIGNDLTGASADVGGTSDATRGGSLADAVDDDVSLTDTDRSGGGMRSA